MAIDRAIATRNSVIGLALLAVSGWLIYQWKPEWFGVSGGPAAVREEGQAESRVDPVPVPVTDEVANQHWVEITGSQPQPIAPDEASIDCDSIELAWRRTCQHLDARFPIEDSYALSVELIQALAESRPAVSGELLQHGVMLQNVFHLFRVIGAERLAMLGEVLEQEDLLEPASHAFYRWLSVSDRCGTAGGREFSVELRSDYAAYLFQTFGGQAYLRRRTPRAEALACFYAIDSIDRAERTGRNSQGYDPRREIPRCRRMLAAESLLLGTSYLETLDRIEAAWSSR